MQWNILKRYYDSITVREIILRVVCVCVCVCVCVYVCVCVCV